MGTFALIVGILGALCGVMGVATAADVGVPSAGDAFTPTVWLLLAGVLFLACIAVLSSRRESE